jgi:Family of unknown function (DUF695)
MDNPGWLTTMTEHQGQKLAVRLRPAPAVSDARTRYGYRLVLIQHLTSVRADGMPNPEYNEGLRSFDSEIIRELEVDGRVVLVETYAGERIYYAYVADKVASKRRATQVLSEYGHQLEPDFRGGQDPDWRFYARYTDHLACGTAFGAGDT